MASSGTSVPPSPTHIPTLRITNQLLNLGESMARREKAREARRRHSLSAARYRPRRQRFDRSISSIVDGSHAGRPGSPAAPPPPMGLDQEPSRIQATNQKRIGTWRARPLATESDMAVDPARHTAMPKGEIRGPTEEDTVTPDGHAIGAPG
jgi:hypothetical protein